MRLTLAIFLAASALFAQPVMPPEATRDEPMGRMEWFYSQRRPVNGVSAAAMRYDAWRQVEALKKVRSRKAGEGEWVNIGPRPTITTGQGSGAPMTSGRVSALAMDPRDPRVLYAGAATGGVWKTTDGGANWTPLTDDQPSLAIGCITLDPNNPDIVYVGTGEANFSADSYYGAGLLKSTDGGKTWRHIPGPFAGPFALSSAGRGARIASIVVHPRDSRILLAAMHLSALVSTASGIYRSTDAGETWTQVLNALPATDLVIDRANPNNLYAGLGRFGEANAGVYKSADAGLTWTRLTSGLPPAAETGRIALAIAPSNPNILYAGIHDPRPQSNSGLRGLYRTADGGANWTALPAPNYCGPQCWYNNSLTVHPTNPNVVVAGGVQIFRSLNGGAAWQNISVGPNGLWVHVDHHAGVFSPDGSVFYDGNDGGVHSARGMTGALPPNWENHNRTLSITQFYPGFSMHPGTPNIMIAGTQDNSTQTYDGKEWRIVTCGDGGWGAIDPLWPETMYTSCQNLSPLKFLPQGSFKSFLPATHGMIGNDRVAFIPPYVMDPSNPQRLYFGTNRVYQTSDGAGVWTAISNDLTNNVGTLTTVAVSPADGRIVWAGSNSAQVHVTANAHETASVQWTLRREGLPNRGVTHVKPDPVNPRRAIVTFSGFSGAPNTVSGHVFETTDLGETWRDITGNLPNMPVNDVEIDPDIAGTLYAATDLGMFVSRDNGGAWEPLGAGLPNTVYLAVKLHRSARLLRAATHGRGMWDLAVPLSRETAGPRVSSLSPANARSGQPLTLAVKGERFQSGSVIRWNGAAMATRFVGSTELQADFSAADIGEAGRNAIDVFTPSEGGGASNMVALFVGGAPSLAPNGYSNAAIPEEKGKPVAPRSLVILHGENFTPNAVAAQTPPLPYTLGGVSVEVNGIPAPLVSVSPTRIVFQLAPLWASFRDGAVRVSYLDRNSQSVAMTFAQEAPGLFSQDSSGTGQGSIRFIQDGVLAAASGRAAKPGDLVEIAGNGFGPASIGVAEGGASPALPLAITVLPVVTIGGVPADVISSYQMPGVVGLNAAVVRVPANAPSGPAVPVRLAINGAESNVVTMAIE
ncbi:MAG: hypothetical protein JNK48_11220 [Bryobacterales bacterium]|nr:hypothetical protein [Bryobacterales bacterium]